MVTGSVEVYERDGRYQIYAREITRAGVGDLYLKYEALKRELEEMGMFAAEYKKPIPAYALRVGVVTAGDWSGDSGYPQHLIQKESLRAGYFISGIGAG